MRTEYIVSLSLHLFLLIVGSISFSFFEKPSLDPTHGIDIDVVIKKKADPKASRKKTLDAEKQLKARPQREKGAPTVAPTPKKNEDIKKAEVPKPTPKVTAPKKTPPQQKPPKKAATPKPSKKAVVKKAPAKRSPPKEAAKAAPKPKEDALQDIIKNLAPQEGGKAEGHKKHSTRDPKRGNASAPKLSNNQISRIQEELRRQVEASWSHSSYKGYDFYLLLTIGKEGKIEKVEIEKEKALSEESKSVAESAQRAILRMQRFKLNKKVFPARLHKEWQQIRMRFKAQRRG